MKSYLLYWIDYYKLRGYIFYNNNEMVIGTFNDRCTMTYQQ